MNESKSTLGTRLVGFVLATSAWNDGISWLPQEEIAEQANVSVREVRYAIEKLVELGELEKRKAQRGRRRVNVYRVLLGARVPQYERLPFDLEDPFVDDDRQDLPHLDDRQNPALTTGKIRRYDRQNPALTPSIGTSKRIVSIATAPNARPRNPIWDALTEVFGDATTETARTRRGKVCRSLTAAHATPDEILRRARSWPRHFDDATLTDLALEKHWDVLGRKPLRMTR